MDVTSISRWQPIFDDLVIELNETSAPDDESGTWHEALARFSRHSFARLLLSPREEKLRVRLEIALGPVESDPHTLAEALSRHLQRISEREDWDINAEDTPWVLQTDLPADDATSEDRLGRILRELLSLSEQFDDISSGSDWMRLLRPPSDSETSPAPSGSAFETIGEGTSQEVEVNEGDATILATSIVRIDDHLHIAIGFKEVLAPRQLDALQEGLETHIHTKFDAQARPVEKGLPAEFAFPPAARTILHAQIDPGGYPDDLNALEGELSSFLDRLDKFSTLGVDLFEYLGVSDTVLESSHTEPAPSLYDQPGSRTREESSPHAGEEAGDGFVFDFRSTEPTSPSDILDAHDFSDPRLRREDAQTPLVDLVLRHPGYSDKRIGQVLSILLSIEYHDALNLAESAPCVIAWGLGLERAQSFKDVIESAGGKAVLVEPGTFGAR